MGDLGDNNNEDDELFDMFMLNEIGKQTGGPHIGGSSGGGCLTSLVLMIAVPVAVVVGIISSIV